MLADGDAPAPPPAVHFWGEHPATEAEFYAAHGVEGESSYFTTPEDAGARRLFTRAWRPRAPERPRATAVFLERSAFACFAPDLPGHGRSHGLRAFVTDLNAAVADLLAFFRAVRAMEEHAGLPCFLFGEPMGGTICLLIHLRSAAASVESRE